MTSRALKSIIMRIKVLIMCQPANNFWRASLDFRQYFAHDPHFVGPKSRETYKLNFAGCLQARSEESVV
jgi:hypothetical protein